MMKRIFVVVLVLVLMLPAALAADVDLKSMTYEELSALRDAITFEMVSRPEWKNVKVEAGEWRVGKDIPAGNYQVAVTTPRNCLIQIWGAEKNDAETNGGLVLNTIVEKDRPLGKVELQDGWLVTLSSAAMFCPPIIPEF